MSTNPSDAEILGLALGAPTRQVLNHAESNGPRYGWKDGFLSREHGVCPPDPELSHNFLRGSLGCVWLQTCARLPALITRSRVRQSVDAMPLISGTSDTVPDKALWAAYTSLRTLVSAYLCEAKDGQESSINRDILPKGLTLPLEQIMKRLGRVDAHFDPYDLLINDYAFDQNAPSRNIYDLRLRYPLSGTDAETRAVLWIAQLHVAFAPAVDLIAQCQEKVLASDTDGLVRVLLDLLKVVKDVATMVKDLHLNDLLAYRRHPLADRIPADYEFPELGLPVFQFLEALLGKSTHTTAHRRSVVALRQSLPTNARAFVAAVESHPIGYFVEQQSHNQLQYAWNNLVHAYYDAHGLLGVYQQKATATQDIAMRLRSTTKAVPTESLGNSRAAPSRQLYEYCNVRAKVSTRSRIDSDQDRTTALVSLLMHESQGLSFDAGDRLLVMPLNSWAEAEKIAAALGLDASLDQEVPLYGGTPWDNFVRQLHPDPTTLRLSVQDVLRYGHIAPLHKYQLETLDKMFHGTCTLVTQLIASRSWPILGTLGDVLQLAIEQVSPVIWDTVFDLDHLSWLSGLIPVAEPRPYGISSPALMGSSLPSSVKITVSRTSYEVDHSLDDGLESSTRFGMTSRALNPHPTDSGDLDDESDYPLMIGVEPASPVRLRSTPMDNIVMFAEHNSVGLFRSFWRSRPHCLGQTVLFLALRSLATYPYEAELAQLQHSGQIQVFASVASDTEQLESGRMLASAILDQGQLVCDLLTSLPKGGLGAHVYLSGSLKLYHSVLTGIKRALYNADSTFVGRSAEGLLADAAAEGRLILDIHADLTRQIDVGRTVSLSQLAQKTGHRVGIDSWVAVSNEVYDLTDVHRIFPADAPTLRMAAGLDATSRVSALTASTPIMGRLLADFRVGELSVRRPVTSGDESTLVDLWMEYLRFAVETLTTLAYETEMFWSISGNQFSSSAGQEALRNFITAQARLMQNGISSVFGVMLQDLHVRTAFAHVTRLRPDVRVPDVMGIVARTRSSKAVAQATKELHALQRILQSPRPTTVQKDGAVQYVNAVAELELHLLETVIGDLRAGVDTLERSSALDEHVTAQLLSVLEHVAFRYQAFWERLGLESVRRSSVRKTLLRQKYDIVQKPAPNGLTTAVIVGGMSAPRPASPTQSAYFIDQTVTFAHLVDQAMQTVNEENLMAAYAGNRKREQNSTGRELAASRTATKPEPTAYDGVHHRKAVQALASFLGNSETAIKRLSQLPADLSFAYIMASYGRNAANASDHARSSSAARSVLRTMDSQSGNDTPRPRLIRRRTNTSSISSAAPQSIFSSPDAATPETSVSGRSSPMPLQLTLRGRERSATKSGGPPVRLARASSSLSYSKPPTLPTVALTSSAVLNNAIEMPPSKGTQLPALLPSPVILERPTEKVKSATPEQRARAANWEMPLVSLSNAEKQANHYGTASPRPALPLQTMNPPRAPPASAQPATPPAAIAESQWFSRKLKTHKAPCTFSGKELPIVTLSKQELRSSSRVDNVPRPQVKHWELPLYTLSRAEQTVAATARGDPVRKPDVPLQAATLPPAPPKTHILAVHVAKAPLRPITPFNGRHLPVLTLSVAERAPRPQVKRWEMPLYTLSRAEKIVPATSRAEPTRKPDVPLQAVTLPSAPPRSITPTVHVAETPARPVIPFNGRHLPVLTLSAAERASTRKQTDPRRTQLAGNSFTSPSTLNLMVRTGSAEKAIGPSMVLIGSPGLWLNPRRRERIQDKQRFGISQTKGHVGLWLQPERRSQNTDFDHCLSSVRSSSPAARHQSIWGSHEAARLDQTLWTGLYPGWVRKQRVTLGYVGLWMQPPSRKVNSDFELVRRGRPVPQAFQTRPEVTTKAAHCPKSKTHGQGLWQYVSDEQRLLSGRTIGYVGMFMKPASRIRNNDFDQMSVNTNKLAASLPCTAVSKPMTESARVFSSTARLWSRTIERVPQVSSVTLGSVGMWMCPPSKKINMDFEELVIRTVNYLLASNSSLHHRMARDMELVTTELSTGPWNLVNWAALGGVLCRSQVLAVPRRAIRPVQPERALQPPSYAGQTLGQLGMWMWPPSRRWNVDFEGFKAATDAAPELESKKGPQIRMVKETSPRAAPKVREANKQTKGFVGLWTEPAARKINLDFEWAKDHAEMQLDEQPVNSMLPAALPYQHQASSVLLPSKEAEKYEFLAQSPSLSTSHTAAMTPTSASTADGMSRHTIDFEDRLRRLNAELDMDDSGVDDFSALSTPTIQEPPPAPLRRNPPSAPEPSRRPELKQLDTATPRQLNNAGLEILSATRYTPDSSSGSASSSLLSPHSAALRPSRPPRPATQQQQQPHIWERDIGPVPSQLPPAPEPAPLRTQSTRQARPEGSRVNSVKNMWEKRASLVMEAPLKLGRSETRSPPAPLKLHRANTASFGRGESGSGRASRAEEYKRDDRQDSATIPGFEMLGGGYGRGRGGEMGMDSPLLSPMSPGVAAY